MKFEKLTINNFLTIGKVECFLDNKGLILIQGDNRDDSSQDSNGAGKSSFPDAILWCLYGSTARGESGDRVVNRKAKKDCFVSVTLSDNSASYTVTRYRKHHAEKNRLTVFEGGKDITKGTDKLTQDLVNKILGCSEEVFCAAIYAGQEAMPDLPGMTDKQLKTIVEEAAGIDRLQEAHLIAQRKLREIKAELSEETGKLSSIKELIASHEDHLKNLEVKKDDFENNRINNLKTISTELRAKKEELESALSASVTAKEKIKDLNAKLEKISEKINAIESEQIEEKKLSQIANEEKSNTLVKRTKYDAKVSEYKKSLEKFKSIGSKVGEPCGECGKHYTKDDMSSARQLAGEKCKTLRAEAEAIKQDLESALERSENAQKALSDFRDKMTNVSAEIAQRDKLSTSIREQNSIIDKVEIVKSGLTRIIDDVKRIKAEENPHLSLIQKTSDGISDKQKELASQEALVKQKEIEVKVAEAAEKVFGPAGVRAHILDNVTPFLNHRTAEYLGTLTDENITALWSTLSTTAKGDLREKFVIDVTSKVGGGNFKSLSGGEKRKVRLACSMALQDLVSSRASKPIELYIADEIDHALDEAGLERLMTILDDKAKTKGTALVISHNSLSDWIRNSVTIVKENGYSRLEGSL